MSDTFNYTFMGTSKRGFEWRVKVNDYEFDYFMGFGHISKSPKVKNKWVRDIVESKNSSKKYLITATGDENINADILNVLSSYNTTRYKTASDNAFSRIIGNDRYYIKTPKYLDVLNCLYHDMQLGQETFQDFCDNCGYDTDSRNALKMYLRCQDTANKLRGFIFPQEIIDGDY